MSMSPAQRRLRGHFAGRSFGFGGDAPRGFQVDPTKSASYCASHRGAGQPAFGFSSFGPSRANGALGQHVHFSAYTPKSDIEWQIHRAAELPGPGEGQPEFGFTTLDDRGGRFNAYRPKTDIDWQCYRAAELPAPGGNLQLSGPFDPACWERVSTNARVREQLRHAAHKRGARNEPQ